tara:strand:- start:101 stop:349 length:249 start_codon:yes stop_codon:yes gene_type:complete
MLKYVMDKLFNLGGENVKESFGNMEISENNGLLLVMILLTFLIELYVIQLIWNNVLSKVINCKQITIWQALSIKVLITFLVN